MCEICRQSICPSGCPNAPDPPVFAECENCGRDIVVGDWYYNLGLEAWCEDCIANAHEEAEEEWE